MDAHATADPAKTSNDELTTSLCGPADRDEQARLFNACFRKSLDGAALSWRYDESPHGGSVSAITRPPAGDGVSGYACSPRLVLVRGREETRAPVGETGDVMTHPEWRKRGIFSALDETVMDETRRLGWPAVFGLPNQRSAHIFLKIGWDQVGTIRPWTFLLRGGEEAKRERFKAGRLAALCAPLDAWRCARARRRLRRDTAGLEVRPLDAFPEEVGALSRRVEERFDFMVRRDAEYLNWRFLRNPSRLHWASGLFAADGRLRGYVVVQLPRQEGAPGFLVDVLAEDEAGVRACVETGLAVLDAAQVAVVQATAIDGSYWQGVLRDAGFLAPRKDNHLIVIRYAHDEEHPLYEAMSDASRWYLTDGDRDDETMG